MTTALIASLVSERRSHRRLPTARKAVLITPEFNEPCIIVDRSSSGLCLVLAKERALPTEFSIEEALTRSVQRVRLVWTAGRQAGVTFTS